MVEDGKVVVFECNGTVQHFHHELHVCSVQCAVCAVCSVCSVQCAVCSVQCAVCSVVQVYSVKRGRKVQCVCVVCAGCNVMWEGRKEGRQRTENTREIGRNNGKGDHHPIPPKNESHARVESGI